MASRLDQPQVRGDFFKSLGTLLAGFVAEQVQGAVVGLGPGLVRPPGVLDEFAFLTDCTRCDQCLSACPQEAILKAPASARLAVGTPYIHPRSMPCFLCPELPCIPACPEKALVWPRRLVKGQEVEGPKAVKMGAAVVNPANCLTWPGEDREAQSCRTCADRCPYPGEAIRMVEDPPGSPPHPVVDAETCTGCGLCEFGCPTLQASIQVEPAD